MTIKYLPRLSSDTNRLERKQSGLEKNPEMIWYLQNHRKYTTRFFYKQHSSKQPLAEIGKKLSRS